VINRISYSYPDFKLRSSPNNLIDVVPGGTATVTVFADNHYNQTGNSYISFLSAPSVPGLIGTSFNPQTITVNGTAQTGQSILTITTTSLTPAGNYTLVITGTATTYTALVHTWAITVRVSGFSLTPSPQTKSVIAGKSTTVTIGVQSLGTFSSPVAMRVLNIPIGMNATLNPATVTPPQGGPASSILTITTESTLSPAKYFLLVEGSSGSVNNSQYVAIIIGDFSISAAPSTRTASQNSIATFTVNGTSIDDYSDTMTLAVAGVPTGVTSSFTPSSVSIPSGGAASSNLSLAVSATAPIGSYVLSITGTSGSQSRMTNVTLNVVAPQDFSLAISPNAATVRNGSSATFTITVGSISSFNSPVALTVSVPPGYGITGSIFPSSVTPPAGGSTTATLTITTTAAAPPGTRVIEVTGTDGSKSHLNSTTLTISPTGGRPCIIATATYGSELAPEVYFLRLFRDQSVQSTFAGTQFMNVFNAWYYSFSPTVAQQVKTNMALRNVAKAVIYPLIGTLYLAQWSYSALSFAPELGIFVAGLVASSLIGIVYFAPITALATELARRKRLNISVANKPFAIAWLASIALILSAELSALPGLMMVATAAFVLSTIALAVKATVTQTQRILH
jgi:hypothetical protein